MIRSKIAPFFYSCDYNKFVECILYKSCRFGFRILFLDTLSCFASVGWRVLKCSKVGSCFHFTSEIALNDEYLKQFFPDHKSFKWHENNFLKSSLNFPCLIATEQYAYCCGGKMNFWSHVSEERPPKPDFFHTNPSRGRIESIKSTGKRSQKVTLITCPRFSWNTYLRLIYIPKNTILRVNTLETSL